MAYSEEPQSKKPSPWTDAVLGFVIIGAATFAFTTLFSPLIITYLLLGTPWVFGILLVYTMVFCFTVYKAVMEQMRVEGKEVTLKLQIYG